MDINNVAVIQASVFLIIDIIIAYKGWFSRKLDGAYSIFYKFVIMVAIVQGLAILDQMSFERIPGVNIGFLYVFYSIEYILMSVVGYFWFLYFIEVRNHGVKRPKKYIWIDRAPLIFLILCIISNYWTHTFFSIEPLGNAYEYVSGKSNYVYAVFFLYIIFCIALIVRQYRRNCREDVLKLCKYLLIFSLPILAGTCMQVGMGLDYGYTQMGMSISILFVYMEMYMKEAHEVERLALLEKNTEQLQIAKTRLSIIQTIFKTYYVAYYLDLRKDTYMELSALSNLRDRYNTSGKAHVALEDMCNNFIHPDYADEMRKFVDLSTLNERLKDTESISLQYKGLTAGWSQCFFVAGDRDEDGNLQTVIICSRMIHEEKELEEEQKRILIEAREEAERANEAKTVFLHNMSHDIRTPMNAILGFAQLMENQKDNPEVIADYLAKLENAGEYLLTIINNVLDMAKIESGNAVVDEELIDISNENNSAIPIFEDEFKNKNITFTSGMNVKHPRIFIDQTKTQQITVNILSNALKYTPEGGNISLFMDELPSEKENHGIYVMTISDTGIGMSKEFVQHVFDNFSREKNTTESKIAGTGLGMPIVKKLVELMGGVIEVDSEPNKGTTVKVTLEHRYVTDSESSVSNKNVGKGTNVSLVGKRILLAEDNELNAEIAKTILEGAGVKVEIAKDGVDCVDMLNRADENHYDIILMDIQMPNLNGYEATERIRRMEDRAKSEIPIIAMTANAFEEDKRAAIAAGMNGHLAKPIVVGELMASVSELLDKVD